MREFPLARRASLLPLLLLSIPARAPYPKSRANSPSRLPLTDPQRVVARALSRSALSDVPAASLLAEVPQGEPRARLLRAAIELTDPRQWRAAIALLRVPQELTECYAMREAVAAQLSLLEAQRDLYEPILEELRQMQAQM